MTYISETDIHAALSKKGWSERDINSIGLVTRWSRSLEAALKTAREWRDFERRQRARIIWCDDDLEIDDTARVVEEEDGGAGYWVQAWVWVEEDE
jgi:sulfite reductase beta subunit-like hemoprotein